MRNVILNVGGKAVGQGKTWAYPNGKALGIFYVPSFNMSVSGVDNTGARITRTFEVLRFGLHCTDGKTPVSVGLADYQRHIIKSWIPTYTPHSAPSIEGGAWQVYNSFLIHDGPDNINEVFATIGCIELMGPLGFVKLNDLLIELCGPTATTRDEQLAQIGRSGKLSIVYEKSTRPPVVKAP
jgi:hypothetical protein